MRTCEFTGKTTQEAIDQGLSELGVTIADVRVEVLQEGAKGLFGLFGSKPARVRITVYEEDKEDDDGLSDLLGSFSLDENARKAKQKVQQKPKAVPQEEPVQEVKPVEKTVVPEKREPEPQPQPQTEPEIKPVVKEAEPVQAETTEIEVSEPVKAPSKPKQESSKKPKASSEKKAQKKPAEPADKPEDRPAAEAVSESAEPFVPTEPAVLLNEDTPAGRAQHFLIEMTKRMNVPVEVYVDDSTPDSISVHMIGDTLGILIGRRGETLDALQYLTSLQVNKGQDEYIRVTVDSENYRAKREDSLRRLALRMANRAQKTGRRVVLEPMNPYERRVLHTTLQNHPVVTTHSEGEEPNRHVVIMLKTPQNNVVASETKEKSGSEGRSSRRKGRRHGQRKNRMPVNAEITPIEENAVVEIVEEDAEE
ncbi:MAG: Jag N-terminal domain-containing protein [Clostridia bacterium]|nr:Jag N-terminal domain-containing protein [Clostridia bacterium]